MLDHNTILEIINSTLPVLASSPVLIKLFGTIENVIKTLYMPTLTLKNGKAEVDVEIYRKKNEAILLNQTFTLYEITKLKNFVKAANFAAAELQNYREQSTNDNNLDFDWIMRFFDAVSNVSNEEMIKELKKRNEEQGIESPYIVCNLNGDSFNDNNYRRDFRRFCERYDIPYRGIHTLRHTFASRLFRKGIDVQTVSKLLGHNNPTITQNIYIHILEEQKAKAIEMFDTI